MRACSIIPCVAVIICIINLGASIKLSKLSFRRPDGSELTVGLVEDADMVANNTLLLEFLKSATVACTTGIWRFYPKVGFEYDIGTSSGYQIGYDDVERCFNIASSNGSLANMRSYRALGPITTPHELDLDQQTITLYSGEFATGERKTYKSDDIFPITNVPTSDFPVQSFVITGQHNVTDADSPVFKCIWDVNGDPINGPDKQTLCITLVKASNGHSKMHFQKKMEFVDEGQPQPIFIGALMYFTYQTVVVNPPVCPKLWRVNPSSTMSSFDEIPKSL